MKTPLFTNRRQTKRYKEKQIGVVYFDQQMGGEHCICWSNVAKHKPKETNSKIDTEGKTTSNDIIAEDGR